MELLSIENHFARGEQYFTAAWQVLADCDLVFFDPDNGIEVPTTAIGARGACKYVYCAS